MTQALVALMVVGANMGLAAYTAVHGTPEFRVPESVTNALFLIVGFYFSRTNHAAIGGIGEKPVQEYRGR